MRTHHGDAWELHAKGAWLVIPCGLDGSFDPGLGQQAVQRHLTWTAEAAEGVREGDAPYSGGDVRLIAAPVRRHHGVHAARGVINESIESICARAVDFKPTLVIPLLGVGHGNFKAREIAPLIERAFGDCPWAVLCFPPKRGFVAK